MICQTGPELPRRRPTKKQCDADQLARASRVDVRLRRRFAWRLGKQVDLQLVGKDTELDRTVVDALGDLLVHLVRNSLDHGLEGPEERVAAGKPATGVLEISAQHAGGNVVISVRDDGRGIDPHRVAVKVAERGLIARDKRRPGEDYARDERQHHALL